MYRFLMAALLLASLSIAAAPNATPVTVGMADLAPIIEEVPLTGTVTSPRFARLSTSVGGLVQEIHVQAGGQVERGMLLLNLDPELEEIALRRAQAATREAKAELADARRRLSDAQKVKRLGITTGEQGMVVSRDALIRYPNGRITVWLIEDSDDMPTVTERRVNTGLAFSGQVEITEGLQPGTRIVLQGNEALQDGQAVRIREGG